MKGDLLRFRARVEAAPNWALLEGRRMLWRKYFDYREQLGWVNEDAEWVKIQMWQVHKMVKMVEEELKARRVTWRRGQTFNDNVILNDNGIQEFNR